jgi:hypothetical protein
MMAINFIDGGHFVGNARGNIYSRKHTNLNPSGEKYWEFS